MAHVVQGTMDPQTFVIALLAVFGLAIVVGLAHRDMTRAVDRMDGAVNRMERAAAACERLIRVCGSLNRCATWS
jgi:hypothetical protein